jgi:hypothetical protein
MAVVAAGFSYSKWISGDWVANTIDIMPNVLGFSLGTYAIIFTIATGALRKAMLETSSGAGGISNLESLNATFVHFIVVQALALIWALLFSASALRDLAAWSTFLGSWVQAVYGACYYVGSFTGTLLLYYSLTLIWAAAIGIYRLALLPNE